MKALLIQGYEGMKKVEEAVAFAKANLEKITLIPQADVSWYPPIKNPGKICGVAMNNSASNDRKISAPDHPAFFLKPPSCLIGHNESIRIRRYLSTRWLQT
jgi:2-keto-4-pentenoate hydratase/2-oxohepta-3-ene-1,7-dioic acid hydratase in catechol pathway